MAFIHPMAKDFSAVAKATLDAAAELGLAASVVKSTSDGQWGMGLIVPDALAVAFHKHLQSSLYPIRVDMDEYPQEPEAEAEAEVEPEPEAKPEKPKRGPRAAKAAAAQPETEE